MHVRQKQTLGSKCANLLRRAWEHQKRAGNGLERALIAAMWIGIVIGALLTTSSAHGVVQLRCSVEPVMVDCSASPADLMTMSADSKAQLAQRCAQAMKDASMPNSGAIVALRPAGFAISFAQLPLDVQATMSGQFGGQETARSGYEHAVSDFLKDVLTRARGMAANLRVSVVGLPVENDAAANATNANVIKMLNAFVSDGSSGAEASDASASMPTTTSQSLELAAGRPIYYQSENS